MNSLASEKETAAPINLQDAFDHQYNMLPFRFQIKKAGTEVPTSIGRQTYLHR